MPGVAGRGRVVRGPSRGNKNARPPARPDSKQTGVAGGATPGHPAMGPPVTRAGAAGALEKEY